MTRVEGVVVARAGGAYRVRTDAGVRDATLRGRMKQEDTDRVLVGDRVTLQLHDDGAITIEDVLPRRSVLRRRNPGGRGRGVRHVAANVDQLVVVGAARDPVWDPQLIDRFTAVAEANGLPVAVVINKSDLDPDAGSLGAPYRAAGYPVLVTSAKTADGLEALQRQLEGHVTVFTGPTGVGKSSLLNALVPGLTLRTGAVSRRARARRHTTVAAEMHPFGEDGYVVDTPGLRDIGLWGLEPLEVGQAFPEFERVRGHCRFDNCRHVAEPGCAVVEAAVAGEIAASRLESYRRLLAEAERAARPWA